MAPTDRELFTEILRACFQAAPAPLYPVRYAAEKGVDRAVLDGVLDDLRLKGLIRLTEWVQGLGQGYTLTQAGVDFLDSPIPARATTRAPAPRLPIDEPEPELEDRSRALIQPRRPWVCWSLIAINILFFVLAPPPTASDRGGNTTHPLFVIGELWVPGVVQHGQWWRIITYAFLHGGLLHVGLNMYFLYAIGPGLESIWGSTRMLLLYLVGAITGGCVVVWANPVSEAGVAIPTVGASGALSGLLASLAVWVLLNRDHIPPNVVAGLTRMVTINLGLLFLFSMMPHVSWQGHLGGAVGGALASFPLQLSRHGEGWLQRIVGLFGAVMVAVVFCVLALGRTWGLPLPF